VGEGKNASVQVGNIVEFYDRSNQVRITGYPIRINAADTVLAQDAWNALAPDLLKKRDDEPKAGGQR
jgi:hypothetical protein